MLYSTTYMPELPEVTTTVTGLEETIKGLTITDLWSDLPTKNHAKKDEIKNLTFWKTFKKTVVNQKISHSERRGKNILIQLHNGYTILIHMKMTGHMLYGTYEHLSLSRKKELKLSNDWIWWPKELTLQDPFNRFIHVMFTLSNKKHLAFCDARKFGKVTLVNTNKLHETTHLKHLGPDALDKKLTFKIFNEQLLRRPRTEIKTVLMDQTCITGIGNIYSDELLWLAGVHPESHVQHIPKNLMKQMFTRMTPLLEQGITLGGDSTSDYRNVYGEHGMFHHAHNAYQRTGKLCNKPRCKGIMKRKIVKGRSAHFCDTHQKLFT